MKRMLGVGILAIFLAGQTAAAEQPALNGSAAASALSACIEEGQLSEPACRCVSGCAEKGRNCKKESALAKASEGITEARCNSIDELCRNQCRVIAEKEDRLTRSDILAVVTAEAVYHKRHGRFISCKNEECTKLLQGVVFTGSTEIEFEAVDEGKALVGKGRSRIGTNLRFTYDSRRDDPKLRQHRVEKKKKTIRAEEAGN